MKLNVKLNVESADTKSAIQSASKAKSVSVETIEQAWERILAQKNSDLDSRKLKSVKKAMDAGKIGREPFKLKANGDPKVTKLSKAEALRLYSNLQEIERQAKLKALVDEKPDNYYLLTTEAEVIELNKKVNAEEIVAFDVETTGLDIFEDELLGISFTLPSVDEHYYVAFQPMDDARALPVEALQLLKDCLENDSVKKVAHNGTFDIAILQRYGIEVANLYHDTMIAMHLLNENEREKVAGKKAGSYQLKYLVPKYLKKEADTFGTLFGKEKDFAKIPLDPFYIYGCKDTQVTYELYEFQRKHLSKMPNMLNYLYTVEMPLVKINLEMEKRGFSLDLEFSKKYGAALNEVSEFHKNIVLSICQMFADYELNDETINSPKQLLPLINAATGESLVSLDAKRSLGPIKDKYLVVYSLLSYRKASKMSGTYIEALPKKINPITGKLHSRFDSNGTVTGRYSSGKDKDEDGDDGDRTNIQNQPYEARKMFTIPKERIWISADFKSQEIVVAGALSDDDLIINTFAQGKDNYAMMAAKAFDKPYEECYKNEDGSDTKYRKAMKVIFLAKLYGMGANSLARSLDTTKDEAQKFSDNFDASMPKMAAWIEDTINHSKRYGFVWIGREQRKRRLPKAKEKTKNIPWGKYWDDEYKEQRMHNAEVARAFRQGPNARIQGEAAIMTKVTMINIDKTLKDMDGFIVAPIHDEIVMEVPDTITKEQIEEIKRVMTQSYTFEKIENGTDLEFFFERWGEGISEKLVKYDENGVIVNERNANSIN